ncbi:hypothetical protein WR25_20102 [Diploscapter pachys]|uniref:RNA-directed DNA polymerase n=1 Tax=Diploscapter pachys TaxID=2018661 RepID=A0A2A2KIU4_9BILA|nr:hypothetical protein WR25_20102 [Diploscapter pachys]
MRRQRSIETSKFWRPMLEEVFEVNRTGIELYFPKEAMTNLDVVVQMLVENYNNSKKPPITKEMNAKEITDLLSDTRKFLLLHFDVCAEDIKRQLRWYDYEGEAPYDMITYHMMLERETIVQNYLNFLRTNRSLLTGRINDFIREHQINTERVDSTYSIQEITQKAMVLAMRTDQRDLYDYPQKAIDEFWIKKLRLPIKRRSTPNSEEKIEQMVQKMKEIMGVIKEGWPDQYLKEMELPADEFYPHQMTVDSIMRWYRKTHLQWEQYYHLMVEAKLKMRKTPKSSTPEPYKQLVQEKTSAESPVYDILKKDRNEKDGQEETEATTAHTNTQTEWYMIEVISRKRRKAVDPKPTEIPDVNSVGSATHIEYMRKTYDHEENTRRNLSSAQLNHRSQFVMEKLQEDLRENFLKIMETICIIQNRMLLTWWAILKLDPTVGIRTILRRDDLKAEFAGQHILRIRQCPEVEVKKIYPNHNINDTCYAKLPIQSTDEQTFFVVPGSLELTRVSPIIDCKLARPYLLPKNNSWFADQTQANITYLPPFHQQMNPKISKLVFEGGDMYEVAKTSSFPLQLAISYGSSIAALQQKQSRLLQIATGAELSSEELEMIRNSEPNIFEQTGESMAEFAKTIGKGYILYVAKVAGVIIGGIAVISIIFGLLKCYIAWKVKRSTPNATVNAVEMDTMIKKASAPEEEEEEEGGKVYRGFRYPPIFSYIPILLPFVGATLHEESLEALPFVTITIADRAVPALWDSGASISYLQENILHQLGWKMDKTHRMRKATTANGSTFQFLGESALPIRIANYSLRHKFLVSKDEHCPCPVLLGCDFMRALEAQGISTSLKPGRGIIEVGNARMQLIKRNDPIFKPTERVVDVIACNACIIAPRGTRNIKIAPSQEEPFKRTEEAILLENQESNQIRTGNAIFHPQDSLETMVQLTNSTDRPISIGKGMKLGRAAIVQLRIIDETGTEKLDIDDPVPPEADWEGKLPEFPQGDILKDLKMDEQLTPSQKRKLKDVIRRNLDAFYNKDGEIGLFKGEVEHIIEIRRDLPRPKPKIYRTPLGKQQEIEKQVEELLRQGVIEPSNSSFSSPIVLVKKKDNSIRFTTDFRALNNVTRKEIYLIPSIKEIIDTAGGKKYYTNIDLASGFYQILLREKDRPLTAFITNSGNYQYCRMAMGLCGAPHTFQKAINELQRSISAKIYTYLDDILIASDTFEQHLAEIEEVLTKLQEFGLKAKLRKCSFAKREINFLGYTIGKEGLKPNPAKVKAITNFPRPKSLREVRGFIGMASYFRRFIPNFAKIAAPLTDLTKKETPFKWNENAEEAFDKLKVALSTAPILQAPRLGSPFTIEVDASGISIGAMLCQLNREANEIHPIAYASRKLSPAETRYPAIELEALAIVYAVAQFRQYIIGTNTTIITDHRPLTTLLKCRDLVGRLAKYQLVIMEYDLTIKYRPGTANKVCDALSRAVIDPEEDKPNEKKPADENASPVPDEKQNSVLAIAMVEMSREEIREIQQKEKWIRDAIQEIDNGSDNAKTKKLKNRYITKHGLLYKKPKNALAALKVILPRKAEIIEPIIKTHHTTKVLAAHMGITKTIASIKRQYEWTEMNEDVRAFIRRCVQCQRRKANPHEGTVEPLGALPETSFPFERVHMDIAGPLPVTENGNRYILTMRDAFTRYLVTAPLPIQSAERIAIAFMENFVLKYGPPAIVFTDQGSNFRAELFNETLRIVNAEHQLSIPFHKNANGIVERAHRVLEECLSAFVSDTQTDWDLTLQAVTFAINALPSETTNISPYEAVFGVPPKLFESKDYPRFPNTQAYVDILKLQKAMIQDYIKKKLATASKRQREKAAAQRRTAERNVKEGDIVLVRREPPKNKLSPYLRGPYKVTKVTGTAVHYEDGKQKQFVAHKDDVRIFESPDADIDIPGTGKRK